MRKVLDLLNFTFLVLVLIGLVGTVSGQNQTVSIAILNFQDDTGASAPAELGQRLAQDLHQKIANSYNDLLPRMSTTADVATIKSLSIEQIAALGKQSGAKFVVRGGLLTLTSEPAGADSKVTVQLYADIISVVTSVLVTTVRSEGSATQSGSAPQLSALDVKSDQFSSSGVGQAFASAIAQLADQIHQAVSGGVNTTTTETAQTATPSPSPLDTGQATTQTTAQTPAQADAAKSAEADTDLQQLITQAETLLSSTTNPNGPSATAASQALQALKSALESKTTLMQSGKDTSQADQDIATQRQALQSAIAQLTAEASAASSSGTASTNTQQQPTEQKKGFMQKVNDFAGQALSLLQNIQQMRTALQGLTESSANSTTGPTNNTGNANAPTDQQLGECNGVVTDQNGAPIPSAQVAEQTSGVSASTDNNGQYDLKGLLANQIAVLNVTASGKTMTAQTPITGGQVATLDFQFKPDATGGTHPIVLPPTVVVNAPAGTKIGSVKGIIRDAQGHPLARALVALNGLGVARTDSLGRYQFLNVPAGPQRLSVSQPGLQTRTTQVRVAAAASTDAPVQFTASDRVALPTRASLLASASGATLAGSVRDSAGNPINGAKISLVQQTSAVAVFTGPAGAFVLNNIKPGPYRVIASKAGYDSSLQNVNIPSGVRASVQFRLNAQSSPAVANFLKSRMTRPTIIRGRVLDANGNPIANATVGLQLATGNSISRAISTNASGEYQFSVEPGKYEVRVSSNLYQPGSRFIEAQAGATAQSDFALKPAIVIPVRTPGRQTSATPVSKSVQTGGVFGQVLDAKTGRPVGGAIVSLSGQQRISTNQTGNFAFANLSPGSYQLIIVNTGYLSIQRVVSILSGETIRLSFNLTPQPSAPVRIRRP